jgi:hypothetical protein
MIHLANQLLNFCQWTIKDQISLIVMCLVTDMQEQFHQSLHSPLFDGHSKKSAVRPNTHFAALKKEAVAT